MEQAQDVEDFVNTRLNRRFNRLLHKLLKNGARPNDIIFSMAFVGTDMGLQIGLEKEAVLSRVRDGMTKALQYDERRQERELVESDSESTSNAVH